LRSMPDKAIGQIPVGFRVNHRRTITEEVIRQFAQASGDFNPLHLDEAYAKRTVFGQRIAHGILTLGLVSAALSKLPGVAVYVSQTVKFIRPVKIGDTVEAVVEVMEKSEDRNEARLRTYAQNQEGDLVLDGEAKVRLFDLGQ
jgi:3-hydroxybutyryl-CoA dehydratase